MKDIFRSMTSRVFLVLIAGILVTTVLTIWLAFGERQRMIRQFRDYHAVERVAQFIQSVENVPADLRIPYLEAAAGIGMHARPAGRDEVVTAARTPLADMLDQRLPDAHHIYSTPPRDGDCPPFANRRNQRRAPDRQIACEALLVTLSDGDRIRLSVMPPRPPPIAPRMDYLTYAILFLLCIGLLAALVARMTMRPLKQLAQAATALGNDIERPPLPENGATEIRQAAKAFNAMQSRLQRHLQQKTHMLAAITHDLQTPLTRLRLRLEKVEDAELRARLTADLSAMHGMIREGLDLARSMDASEAMQKLDLDSLLDSVCVDAADAGHQVSFNGKTGISIAARPLALRRCLTNLIDNAVKYGQHAEVDAQAATETVSIWIRDGGPGIPDSEFERVFEPFYRVESSRSRNTGGSGLGLTIARNIVEQHGGTIALRNRREGGLEVTLTLPRMH